MKGKLIKRSNSRFDFYTIEDINQVNTIASSFDNPNGKLSVKNCEAIANGYDLDELAKEHSSSIWGSDADNIGYASYYQGFQKALEILGDKKFSEEKMKQFAEYVWKEVRSGRMKSMDELFNDWVAPQQIEWNVEIEMEYYDPLPPTRQTALRPKLDSDGCLILKRV